MKKLYMLIALAMILSISAQAYMIGGAYATLISCKWGQYGYQYGNIGTYEVNGETYRVFFGDAWCEY